jgi:hypothetical protein
VLAHVLRSIFQKQLSIEEVRVHLFKIGQANSAAFLRDMVVMRYAELYQQEDCSVGNHSEAMSAVTVTGELNSEVVDPLRAALRGRIGTVNREVAERLEANKLDEMFDACQRQVVLALDPSKDDWKRLFPGKVILQRFGKEHDLGHWPALQNLTIEAMAKMRPGSVSELRGVFQRVAGGGGAADAAGVTG